MLPSYKKNETIPVTYTIESFTINIVILSKFLSSKPTCLSTNIHTINKDSGKLGIMIAYFCHEKKSVYELNQIFVMLYKLLNKSCRSIQFS